MSETATVIFKMKKVPFDFRKKSASRAIEKRGNKNPQQYVSAILLVINIKFIVIDTLVIQIQS